MKIRIKGNSIRLRLTQSEVSEFKNKGIVEEMTNFPGGNAFCYAIALAKDSREMSVKFDQGKITITVPLNMATLWFEDEQVSINHHLRLSDGNDLLLLVEKDFQCLKPRVGENEEDNYPNPLAEKI